MAPRSFTVPRRGRDRGPRRRADGCGTEAVRRRRAVHPERRAHLALLRSRPQPGRARRRHPSRAVRHVRRGGLGQADPSPRRRCAHCWPGHHERRLGGHVGVVQRLTTRRPGWASTPAALGRGVAAGARPRADPQLDHEVVDDAHGSDEGRRGRARGCRAGDAATPGPGVHRLPARCLRAGLGRSARGRARPTWRCRIRTTWRGSPP